MSVDHTESHKQIERAELNCEERIVSICRRFVVCCLLLSVCGEHSTLALRCTHCTRHTRSVARIHTFRRFAACGGPLLTVVVLLALLLARTGCYPYQLKDPFVLKESPHLYIVGNQSAYSTRLVQGADGQLVRAVCVPSFAATGTAVLVDLHSPTMETRPISFKVQQAK